MTQRLKPTVFLERQAYKRRRMRDLARGVPIIGAVLLGIPLLWTHGGPQIDGATTSQALVYIFLVWMFLVGLAALVSRTVQSDVPPADVPDPD